MRTVFGVILLLLAGAQIGLMASTGKGVIQHGLDVFRGRKQ